MTSMLAARAYPGERRFRLEEVAVPEPGPGEALIRVASSGITSGLLSLWWSRGRIKLLPATLGHQVAGLLAGLGPGAGSWREGDRVRLHAALSCRDCRFCRNDLEPFCSSFCMIGHGIFGENAMPLYEAYHDGGLAGYVRVPVWALDPLPEQVSFEIGAKIHDLAVASRALKLASLDPGSTLLLTGATGAAGSATVRLAPMHGVARIIAVSRSRAGLERLRRLDPALVAPVALEELPRDWQERDLLRVRIRELAGGGPDALVDYVPDSPAVTVQAILSLRKAATAVLVGGSASALTLPYAAIRLNGYRIVGSTNSVRRDATELIELLAGDRLWVDDLITHRFPLSRVNDAVRAVETRAESPWLVSVQVAAST